jgi:hypothetical protein
MAAGCQANNSNESNFNEPSLPSCEKSTKRIFVYSSGDKPTYQKIRMIKSITKCVAENLPFGQGNNSDGVSSVPSPKVVGDPHISFVPGYVARSCGTPTTALANSSMRVTNNNEEAVVFPLHCCCDPQIYFVPWYVASIRLLLCPKNLRAGRCFHFRCYRLLVH